MTAVRRSHYWSLEVGCCCSSSPSEDWTAPCWPPHSPPSTPGAATTWAGRWETTCWLWRLSSPRSRWRCWASRGWRCGVRGWAGGTEVCTAGTESPRCSSALPAGGGACWVPALRHDDQVSHWRDSPWTSSSHWTGTRTTLSSHHVTFSRTQISTPKSLWFTSLSVWRCQDCDNWWPRDGFISISQQYLLKLRLKSEFLFKRKRQ